MLGWDHDTIMSTPIACLELAIKGRGDFVKNILQSVFGKSEGEKEAEKLADQTPDPARAAQQLMAFVESRKAQDARHRRKK